MKIRAVRLMNLNSLAGEWEIDFTNPAFATEGIFVITGPTGAGKSTILDAICLALYGATPRLGKITQSSNEIMARKTASCFAEVTFETQKGVFCCHWSQRRARGRSDGQLQAPQHEITDMATGQVLENSIRGVAEQVQEKTGLDLGQFTRSILLAQGGFAAFLQAKAEERAPLLEQLTGTERYGELSVMVHQRCSAEKNELKRLQDALGMIAVLSEQEEQALQAALAQKDGEARACARQLESCRAAIAWRMELDRLEAEHGRLAQERGVLQGDMVAFEPRRQRLDAAQRALALQADHAMLLMLRETQARDRHALQAAQATWPAIEKAATEAAAALVMAQERVQAARDEQESMLPILGEVRTLDVRIKGKEGEIEAAVGRLADHDKALEILDNQQNTALAELAARRKALARLQEQLEATAADGQLVTALAGLQERARSLHGLEHRLAEHTAASTQATQRLEDIMSRLAQATQRLEASRQDQQQAEDALEAIEARRKALLGGLEVQDWHQRQNELRASKEQLDKTLAAVQACHRLQQEKTALEDQQGKEHIACSRLEGELARCKEKHQALAAEQVQLEGQQRELDRMASLEVARSELEDGKPCPLCGATEHPYARGHVPSTDAVFGRLAELRGALQATLEEMARLGEQLAMAKARLQQLGERHGVCEAALHEAERDCTARVSTLGLPSADSETLETLLAQQRSQHEQRLAAAEAAITQALAIQQELEACRGVRERAQGAVHAAENLWRDIEHDRKATQDLLQRLESEADAVETQRRQALGALGGELLPFGVQPDELGALDAVLDAMQMRCDQWCERQQQAAMVQQLVEKLATQISMQEKTLAELSARGEALHQELDHLHQQRNTLLAQRKAFFGEGHPDETAAQLASALTTAEQTQEAARAKAAQTARQRDLLEQETMRLAGAIEERTPLLHGAEQAFAGRLAQAGFADEAAFAAACLAEAEREALAGKAAGLAQRQVSLETQINDNQRLLAEKRAAPQTQESLLDLERSRDELEQTYRALNNDVGALRQQLSDNETNRQQRQRQLEAIAAQERAFKRFELLDELIGSADGKKYRLFVQNLIFDQVIGFANQQLQRLTERYLLVRDPSRALELNVMDHYQGGVLRSTKNLSGGESFIVSLALALGLSRMASRRVRLDSLFLDEGFGTLDEETLETALTTLAALHQEGKLIGVISHIPALKERIPTRIQVTPHPYSGRSRLDGPGCRQRVS